MSIQEYDVVRLRRALPEHQLPEGSIGAVVMIYRDPPAYEVEFCDSDGVTIALATLSETDLEKVPQ